MIGNYMVLNSQLLFIMDVREVECQSNGDVHPVKCVNEQKNDEEETCFSKAETFQAEDLGEKYDQSLHKDNSKIRAWLPSVGVPVSLVGVVLMSFSDLFMEISTRSMNPVQVTVLFAFAMFLTSFVCASIHAVSDKHVMRRKYTRTEWLYLLLCALTNAGAFTLINFAIKFMPVGDAVSILRSMPIFAGIMGWILLKQTLRKIDIPFIFICMTGVVLIARPTFIFHSNTNDTYGNKSLGTILALVSSFCFALSFSVGKKLSDSKIQSYIIISINSCVNLFLNCVIWFTFRRWDCAQSYVILLTLAGGVLTAVGQIIVFWSFSREKVVVITVILATNIIYVYVLQILVVHIIPHWSSGLGALLILITCVGMAIRKDDKMSRTVPEIETAC